MSRPSRTLLSIGFLVTGAHRLLRIRVAIAWRLGFSFAAVAVLAATANYIVARGHSFIKTTEVVVVAPVVAQRPAVTQITSEPNVADRVDAQGSRNLEMALDRYETAVIARTQTDSVEAVAQLHAAENNLQRATTFFASELDGIDVSGHSLRKTLQRDRTSAAAMIALSDQRRSSLAVYAAQFETINARMKQSVDGAWKIFGRVVARQSLIQLSNELDEIRRRFAELKARGVSDTSALAALTASEQTFATTLHDNERSLTRSQGAEWVSLMREDFERILTARRDIERADAEWHEAEQAFATMTSRAHSVIANVKASSIAAATKAAQQSPSIVASDPIVATTSAPISSPSAEIVVAPANVERRRAIALVTVAALAILLAISISTVLSIVRPVRRMLDATEQLAHGHVQLVPGGGIKELDTLAAAFNRMAEEVTATRERMREYQGELETRVEQRTLQLQELAEQDPLTRLPNRRQFFLSLDAALAQAAATESIVGVFFLDLDNFKNINDSMGHEFGDRVLVTVAERLKTVAKDVGFAARLGGDEFTVVLGRANTIDEVRDAGNKIIAAFQKPLWIDNRELVLSISVGASVYPDHDRNSIALLRAADIALFHAKALGRSQLAMFSPELLDAAAAKFSIEQGLRHAIERSEFELVFQPEISAENLTTTIVEALLRWRMPDGRLASPGEFLAVAEESGLIVEIGEWVLRAAIRAAADWHHGSWPDARVAINVSPRQLLDGRFVDKVTQLLQEFRLPPRCIEIELTENVLQTGPHVIDTLRRLRSLGIAIALDDFGTGYSSLSSLEQLPLTRIKLDRSLIARIDSNARSAAIARAIVAMCHGLGLEVTAEGIERPEQFNMLMQHRRMFLQGYLLSRPVPEVEVLATFASSERRARQLVEVAAGVVLQEVVQQVASG
jgi:diguanylate cyclase (GGDEF)-like protein